MPRNSPSVALAILASILSALVVLSVGCDEAEDPGKVDLVADGAEGGREVATSLEERLVGDWNLDRAATIAATKAAAESAGKGPAAAEAALRDYLENKATPEDAADIKELLEEGTRAEEIVAMLDALETAGSPEGAAGNMVAPIDELDLALDLSFDGEAFRTSAGRRSWRYLVREDGESPGHATLEFNGDDDPWSLRFAMSGDTLTIDANDAFRLRLAASAEDAATLPSPMILVFKRSAAAAPEGD